MNTIVFVTGHMAVKIGKAMGVEITVISTSERKRKMALSMGADHFVVSSDDKQMLVSLLAWQRAWSHIKPTSSNSFFRSLSTQIHQMQPLERAALIPLNRPASQVTFWPWPVQKAWSKLSQLSCNAYDNPGLIFRFLQEVAGSLDGIIDTVSADHDIEKEIGLLKIEGKLVFVGVPPKVSCFYMSWHVIARMSCLRPCLPICGTCTTSVSRVIERKIWELYTASLECSSYFLTIALVDAYSPDPYHLTAVRWFAEASCDIGKYVIQSAVCVAFEVQHYEPYQPEENNWRKHDWRHQGDPRNDRFLW